MPRRNVKRDPSRYGKVSILKPKPIELPPPPKEEIVEIIVDPYSYIVSDYIILEEPLVRQDYITIKIIYEAGFASRSYTNFEFIEYGQDEHEAFKYTYDYKRNKEGRFFTDTFVGGENIKFVSTDGSHSVEEGDITSTNFLTRISKTYIGKRKMYAYKFNIKYLPKDFRGEKMLCSFYYKGCAILLHE